MTDEKDARRDVLVRRIVAQGVTPEHWAVEVVQPVKGVWKTWFYSVSQSFLIAEGYEDDFGAEERCMFFAEMFTKALKNAGLEGTLFALGGAVWSGMSKLLEEMGELQQLLGKLIQTGGSTKHWDGDLREKLIEELGDTAAAIGFFVDKNFTLLEQGKIETRAAQKRELFEHWHADPKKP